MAVRRRLYLLAALFGVLIFAPIYGQADASNNSQPKDSQTTDSTIEKTSQGNSQPWKHWGLTESDWERYTEIMAGPRGIWSPDISPVSALGIHAKTEAERSRYAEIAAKQDWQRLMDERAWFRTYAVVKDRYFTRELEKLQEHQPSLNTLSGSDHLVLFTDDSCNPQCRRALHRAQKTGAQLDIFFVGVSDASTIGDWAKANQIPPKAVNQTGEISLNLDKGTFSQIALDQSLPQLFMRGANNQLTEVAW